MDQAQIISMMATGQLTPEQGMAALNALKGAAPAPAAQGGYDPLLAGIRGAQAPNQAGQNLVDDDGKFDGTYAITVKSVSIDQKRSGKLMRTVLRIDESTNSLVPVGTEREYVLFLWNPPALSEAQGWLQQLSDAKGNVGQWSDAFYQEVTTEQNSAGGLRFKLSVFTTPQKNNKTKFFTHHRFESIGVGALGLTTRAAAAPAPTMAMPAMPAQTAPAAAAPAQVAGLPSTPPPGWPSTVPWPGAR